MQNAVNTADPSATITSGVNESRFIEHMRDLFSTSKVVLSELMQNARRAGASKVMFDFAGGNLVVTDDGCGIDDFQKLIVVAESGWSEEVMACEQPFGIGFSSVSFSADRILVQSKGRSIAFTSEDLIAKRPIAVRTSDFIGGTRIILSNFRVDEKDALASLRQFAMGFSIPVIVTSSAGNSEELPRPHAIAALKGTQTEYGFFHIPGVHGDAHAYSNKAYLYVQGLPVKAGALTNDYGRNANSPVIHVNHQRFKPRVPDRDVLIDAAAADAVLSDAHDAIWRAHLVEEKSRLDPAIFADRYWYVAQMLRCTEIFNDVPVLPAQALSRQSEYPVIYDGNESSTASCKEPVTKEQVESGQVRLCYSPDFDLNHDSFARIMFAQAKGFVYVETGLHADHWAVPHVIDLENGELQISGETLAEGFFDGRWTSGTVKLMKEIVVTLNGESATLSDAVAVTGGADDWNVTFHVPAGDDRPAYVLRQASSYRDENDDFQELAHDIDWDDFNNLVAILAGEKPDATLSKCLRDAGASTKTNLRGQRFTVAIDAEGNFSVEVL